MNILLKFLDIMLKWQIHEVKIHIRHILRHLTLLWRKCEVFPHSLFLQPILIQRKIIPPGWRLQRGLKCLSSAPARHAKGCAPQLCHPGPLGGSAFPAWEAVPGHWIPAGPGRLLPPLQWCSVTISRLFFCGGSSGEEPPVELCILWTPSTFPAQRRRRGHSGLITDWTCLQADSARQGGHVAAPPQKGWSGGFSG